MKVLTGRAYANKNVWQKIKLRKNYAQALQQIELHLAHWPRFLVHKNKQRLTRIYQYLVRSRKLDLSAPLRCVRAGEARSGLQALAWEPRGASACTSSPYACT